MIFLYLHMHFLFSFSLDLLRHTPTTDTDYHNLVKVVHSMVGLAKAMNDTQKVNRRKTLNL
jgi:hypothetical protein